MFPEDGGLAQACVATGTATRSVEAKSMDGDKAVAHCEQVVTPALVERVHVVQRGRGSMANTLLIGLVTIGMGAIGGVLAHWVAPSWDGATALGTAIGAVFGAATAVIDAFRVVDEAADE